MREIADPIREQGVAPNAIALDVKPIALLTEQATHTARMSSKDATHLAE